MATSDYPSILCTVDTVLLTLVDNKLSVALFTRNKGPEIGKLALPGGTVHAQEDANAKSSALRVLREKTGVQHVYVEQLATFSGMHRDPRGWSMSVVYYALVSLDNLRAQAPAGMTLLSVDDTKALSGLAFDHTDIVACAAKRVRSKTSYSSLPAHLLGERFTLRELQAVYESILGEPVNKVSFRRKMVELDVLEEIPGEFEEGKAFRPAQLYRLRKEFAHELSLSERALNNG